MFRSWRFLVEEQLHPSCSVLYQERFHPRSVPSNEQFHQKILEKSK